MPPLPEEDSFRSRNIEYLPKPLGCLPLNCLLRTRTARINDGHASYFAEAPCFLAPLTTLKLFSLPVASGASLRLALGPHPPPTMRSCFIGTGRGGIIAREIIASHVQAPPLRFVLRLRLQRGGGIFARHYGNIRSEV